MPAVLHSCPSPEQTRELLLQSLSISDARLVSPLLDSPAPSGWAANPLLRYHRAIFFDASARAEIAGYSVELHPSLGFRILRKATL
jgi:hypothetical protein